MTLLDLAIILSWLLMVETARISLKELFQTANFIIVFPGLQLEAQSLHQEALMTFSFALSVNPDYVPSMVCMARILRKLGGKSLSIARAFLQNALRLDPTSHRAWMDLGLVLKSEGSLLEAADCFQTAYELRELSPIQDFSEQLPIMLQ
jgi:tetratricopeptide repeat protein 7